MYSTPRHRAFVRTERILITASLGLLVSLASAEETTAEDESYYALDEVQLQAQETVQTTELSVGNNAKLLAPVMETARSIEVISEEEFTARGARDVQGSLGYTAGVYAGPWGMDSRQDNAKIRGIAPLEFQDGFQSHIGNYNTTRPDIYTLESVQAIKGPASVLYGQGAVGGILNVNSKLPKAEFGGELNLQYGSHNRQQAALDVTGPIDDESKFLYRVVAVARNSDTQVDYVTDDARILMPSFTWQPTEATSLTFLLNLQENEGGSTFQFLPLQDPILQSQNLDIDPEVFIGEPGWDRYDTEQQAFSFFFDHEINETWSISVNGRYSHGEADYRYHQGIGPAAASAAFGLPALPDGQIYRLAYISDADLETLSGNAIARAEFETGDFKHRMQFGVDMVDATRNDDRPQDAFGLLPRGYFFPGGPFTPTVIDLENPVYSGAPVSAGALNGTLESGLEQFGIFVGDVIRYDRWILSAAARYDWVEQTTNNPAGSSQAKNDELSLEGGVLYAFENGLSPYYSYAEAFQANDVDTNGELLDVRTGYQHELGVKYQPQGGNMFASAAVFYIDEENRAQGTIDTTLIDATYVGLELHWVYRWEDFTFDLTYTYTDAEQGEGDLQVPQIPENMATAWISYAPSGGKLEGFRTGFGIRYADATQSLRNTAQSESYTVCDAMLGYAIQNWDFQLNVSNLFDKEYVIAVSDMDELLPTMAYGPSRFLNLSATYKF